LVGDVVLNCTGGNSALPFLANFQIFLNTNITSRLLGGSALSEATLLIDEPGTTPVVGGATRPFCASPDPASNVVGLPGSNNPLPPLSQCNNAIAGVQTGTYNAFAAQTAAIQVSGQTNSVVWAGIPVIPPGTSGIRTFRFTNLRANANGLGTSNTLIPTQIVAFISVSGSQSLAINNPQQTVAYIQQGLQFAVTSCTGGSASTNLLQCTNVGSNLNTDPAGTGAALFGLRFREGFQTAFKPRILPGQEVSIPGSVYNSESGFIRGEGVGGFKGDTLGSIGVANTGTRVAARFNNVPAGVRLYVATNSSVYSTSGVGAAASLINADASGNGGIISGGITPTATLTCNGASQPIVGGTSTGANAVELTVVNGVATAVWEITNSNPSVNEDAFFLVGVASTSNTGQNLPGLGTATVTGNFAPFYAANSGANIWSASLPIPRFIDNPVSSTAFTYNACVSNLLFPFVTNQAGFDTGIAISNTSSDPFAGASGRVQSGNCTINYYGNTTGGGAAPAKQTTTSAIASGAQLTFVLSSGGGNGIAGTPGFQGYIIAQCNFRYAHGFAFITDGPIGQANVAEGYLALVMDDSQSPSRTGSVSEVLSH
jgi:hypothetical protein